MVSVIGLIKGATFAAVAARSFYISHVVDIGHPLRQRIRTEVRYEQKGAFEGLWKGYRSSLIDSGQIHFVLSSEDLLEENYDLTFKNMMHKINKEKKYIRSKNRKKIEESLVRNFIETAQIYKDTKRLGRRFESGETNLLGAIRFARAKSNTRDRTQLDATKWHLDNIRSDAGMLTMLGCDQDHTKFYPNFLLRETIYSGKFVASRQCNAYHMNTWYEEEITAQPIRKGVDYLLAGAGFPSSGVIHRAPRIVEEDRIQFLFFYDSYNPES
ncbi:MAG: hypothetical protein AB8G05_04215 [Oligoflexales bacterium]